MLEKEKAKKAIKEIVKIIEGKRKVSNKDLIEICEQEGLRLMMQENDFHLIHELLEVAVNIYISQKYVQINLNDKIKNSEILPELKDLEKQIPVQSWRSEDQQRLQQFSTPGAIALLMTKILNPAKTDLIMEPSAGTGSLAIWLRIIGCKVQLNEISARRRALLELQDFAPTSYNAEFIDDLMPEEIKPDGVLMNPPFSASAGRVKNADSTFGFRHVKSALARLNENGRLVALLGSDALLKSDKGRKFLDEISTEHNLKAVFTMPKNAFYKYGTNFQTAVVCIEKGDPTGDENRSRQKRKAILEIDCRSLEECLSFADVFE